MKKMKVKFLFRQVGRLVQRMRNILAILALFVCTSICLGQNVVNVNTNDGTGNYYTYAANSDNVNGRWPWKRSPINCTLNISGTARALNALGAHICCGSVTGNKVNVNVGRFNNSIITVSSNVCGAWIGEGVDGYKSGHGNGYAHINEVRIISGEVRNDVCGAIIFNYIHEKGIADKNVVHLTNVTVGNNVHGGWIGGSGVASRNEVKIISGKVDCSVHGGYVLYGTVTRNIVDLTSVTVTNNVIGGAIGKDGLASNNEVTITSGIVTNVFGGRVKEKGTVTENEVHLTSVTVKNNVYGGWIGGSGLASSNEVTIKGGKVDWNVFGGYIKENGTASSNTVHLTSVPVSFNVYGAWIENGLASSNTVTIISGAVHAVLGGYIGEKGTATINTVNLTSVTVGNNVFGAKIGKDGLARDNRVTIKGGKIEGEVLGGYIVEKGTATGNTVNLTSVTVTKDVYGAMIANGLASSNEVTIKGGKVDWNVFGGYIKENGTASSNTVHLTSVAVGINVFGALIANGLASSNTVTIISGAVQNVHGGHVKQNGTATLNKVHLTSVTVGNNVFGARIGKDGLVRDNRVTIKGGKIEGEVLGGCIIEKGTATINRVNLTSVTVTKSVFGARIGKDGLARGNEVTISSGAVHNVYGGYIFGNGTATRNKVKLTSVDVNGNVYGASGGGASSNTVAIISNNEVTIISGTVWGDVVGGYVKGNGKATGNKVNLTNVTVSGDVYGAKIDGDVVHGTGNGSASNNTVIINGGKIRGDVFGGFLFEKGEAINNTITITGSPEFSNSVILCGGVCVNGDPFTAKTSIPGTGNTLNIKTKGVVVNGISNFENYNFYLPEGILPGETILTAKDGGRGWNANTNYYTPDSCAVNLKYRKIKVYNDTNTDLNEGYKYILIDSMNKFIIIDDEDQPAVVLECEYTSINNNNPLIDYKWKLEFNNYERHLIARLVKKEESAAAKLVAGEYGALIGLVNQGTDFVVSRIEEAERLVGGREGEIEVFFGVGANKSEYNTGTEIEMVGTSMMGGIGIGVEVGGKELCSKEQSSKEQSSKDQSSPEQSSKELVTGVFVEHGNGDSEVICEKKSKGSNEYIGGGVLGKYNFYEDDKKGRKLYGEAVLRAGRVSNKFKGNGLKDARGRELEYEAGMMYGGCEAGLGYKHKVSEKIDVDWSLRYMFGRQNEKDVTMSDERIVKFESVLSNRIRLGVRGKYEGIEQIKPYVGIGYEHELSGKIKAVVPDGKDQVEIPASSFGGGTGIVELGVSGKVWKLDVDISGQGYLGVRKGFGGLLKLKYAFGKDAHAKPQPKD